LIDFSKLRLSDASIDDVRIHPLSVEVDYVDWQEKAHTLVFDNAISCFALSPHRRALSHGEVEDDGEYLRECCEVAEEDLLGQLRVFNFIEVWGERKILRIVAETVSEKCP
jgi:hypothetical protein